MAHLSACGYIIGDLECRPNSTCKLFNPELTSDTCKSTFSLSSKTDHVGVTNLERLDQGHLHPKLEVPDMSRTGIEPGLLRWEAALAKSYSNCVLIASEHLHMSPRQSHNITAQRSYIDI